MKRTARFLTFLPAVFLFLISPLYADSIGQGDLLLELDSVFIGSSAPSGTQPWLAATFTNLDPVMVNEQLTYRVQLTMSSGGLATGSGQSVGSWFFNVTDELPALGLLQFDYLSGDSASVINRVAQAAGPLEDFVFDIKFEFLSTSSIFGPGETSSYLISSTFAIDALSFAFPSTSGAASYYSASNILGLAAGGSWIGAVTAQTPGPGPGPTPVPEPATVILLGLALTGLTFFYGKRNTA